jgi:hypothetical protein
LEAAPTSGTAAWTDATYAWSGNTSEAIGAAAQGTAIGTGYQNSLDIVAQTGNVAATSAAVLAREYGGGSKTDWHLPSKDELAQLRTERTTVDGLSLDGYWSSSEVNESYAWYQNFGFGYQNYDTKDNSTNFPYYVRPVRAF